MTAKAEEQQLTQETQAVVSVIADLEAKLAAMEKRLKEAEDKQGKQPKEDLRPMERADTPEPGGAWIIKAPLDSYSGETAKVTFTNGWGVVYPDGKEAARMVHQLEYDFGYQVLPVDADTLAQFQKRMSGAKVKAPGSLAEKLSMPQVMK